MRVFLESRLQHPDLGLDLDRLVGAHDWIGLLLPALLQRTAAGFYRLEKFEIFALFVMVGLDFVGQYIYVVDLQVFQDVVGKVVDLKEDHHNLDRYKTSEKFITYVFPQNPFFYSRYRSCQRCSRISSGYLC